VGPKMDARSAALLYGLLIADSPDRDSARKD
jgi:hypothetical protein